MNRSEVENQDYVYIDYEDGHILPNQTFVIPFVVNSEKIVIDFNYEQNGFEVLSTSITNNKQINFELSCITNSSEYWLSLQITLNSNSIVNSKLFAVVKENGVFVSQFSKNDALEQYFAYSLKDETLTKAEIGELRSEIYSSSVIEKGYTVMGKDTLKLPGLQSWAVNKKYW
jgi:hypothetical protein